MNKYVSTIFRHWKSTVTGILVAVITTMFYLEKIDTQEWIIAIGGIASVAAMVSKDPDKTQSKE